MKEVIKGSCESCGFEYMGEVEMFDCVFPDLKCPHCGEETQNFDDSKTIDALDKAEGRNIDYKKVVFA